MRKVLIFFFLISPFLLKSQDFPTSLVSKDIVIKHKIKIIKVYKRKSENDDKRGVPIIVSDGDTTYGIKNKYDSLNYLYKYDTLGRLVYYQDYSSLISDQYYKYYYQNDTMHITNVDSVYGKNNHVYHSLITVYFKSNKIKEVYYDEESFIGHMKKEEYFDYDEKDNLSKIRSRMLEAFFVSGIKDFSITTYNYYDTNELKEIIENSGSKRVFKYNKQNLISELQEYNDYGVCFHKTSYQYNDSGLLMSEILNCIESDISDDLTGLYNIVYKYNALGLIENRTEFNKNGECFSSYTRIYEFY